LIRRAAAVCLFLLAACRTIRPPNAETPAPLNSTSPAEAERQLAERRAQFRGERSLIRLKMAQLSARAQLQVDAAGRMLLTMYSPIGTTLARLYADGDDVVFLNDFEATVSRGKAQDFGAFGGPVPFLLIGLPGGGQEAITYGPAGIENARLPDTTIHYDPAVYPPKRVVIDHGNRHIEIEHLESFADPAMLKPPEIPSNYRCCVPPPL